MLFKAPLRLLLPNLALAVEVLFCLFRKAELNVAMRVVKFSVFIGDLVYDFLHVWVQRVEDNDLLVFLRKGGNLAFVFLPVLN